MITVIAETANFKLKFVIGKHGVGMKASKHNDRWITVISLNRDYLAMIAKLNIPPTTFTHECLRLPMVARTCCTIIKKGHCRTVIAKR